MPLLWTFLPFSLICPFCSDQWLLRQPVLKHRHFMRFVSKKRSRYSHPRTTKDVIMVFRLFVRQFSFFYCLMVGWDHVSGTTTSVRPIGHPPGDGWMNMEYRWNGICHWIAEALSKEPVRMPLCLPQTTHALSCGRTRVCAARTCLTGGHKYTSHFRWKTYITFQINPTNSLVAEFLMGWNDGFIAARRGHMCCQRWICHVKMHSQTFFHQNRCNWRVQRCANPQPYIVYKNVHRVVVKPYM
jgi:hypothetical protein